MVDRTARAQLALALRRLASGRMTNDQFDDEAFCKFESRTDDPALSELATFGWSHYSDLYPHRLRGRHALSREERRGIARAVVFLKSDQEYVHGTFNTNETTLSNRSGLAMLVLLMIAGLGGIFTRINLGTFNFGFFGLLTVSCVLWLLLHLAFRICCRTTSDDDERPLEDTDWPWTSKRAMEQGLQYWPFENETCYKAAL